MEWTVATLAALRVRILSCKDEEKRIEVERLLNAPYDQQITAPWIAYRLMSLTPPQLEAILAALEIEEAPGEEAYHPDPDGWDQTSPWGETEFIEDDGEVYLDDHGRDPHDPFYGWVEGEDGVLYDPMFAEVA